MHLWDNIRRLNICIFRESEQGKYEFGATTKYEEVMAYYWKRENKTVPICSQRKSQSKKSPRINNVANNAGLNKPHKAVRFVYTIENSKKTEIFMCKCNKYIQDLFAENYKARLKKSKKI